MRTSKQASARTHAHTHETAAVPVVIEFKAVNLCCEVLERLLWAWAARRQVFLVINVHNASLRPEPSTTSNAHETHQTLHCASPSLELTKKKKKKKPPFHTRAASLAPRPPLPL